MKYGKLIFLMLPVLIFACVVPQEGFIIGNAKAKVCILYYDSNFKKELVNKLGQDLNDQNISAYVDTINNMNNYDPAGYDAVILISGVVAGNPLPLTAEYITKHNYKNNIIYYCAFFISKDAVYGISLDQNKIDVITSASYRNLVEGVSKEIVQKVLKITG